MYVHTIHSGLTHLSGSCSENLTCLVRYVHTYLRRVFVK